MRCSGLESIVGFVCGEGRVEEMYGMVLAEVEKKEPLKLPKNVVK